MNVIIEDNIDLNTLQRIFNISKTVGKSIFKVDLPMIVKIVDDKLVAGFVSDGDITFKDFWKKLTIM